MKSKSSSLLPLVLSTTLLIVLTGCGNSSADNASNYTEPIPNASDTEAAGGQSGSGSDVYGYVASGRSKPSGTYVCTSPWNGGGLDYITLDGSNIHVYDYYYNLAEKPNLKYDVGCAYYIGDDGEIYLNQNDDNSGKVMVALGSYTSVEIIYHSSADVIEVVSTERNDYYPMSEEDLSQTLENYFQESMEYGRQQEEQYGSN